MPLVPQAAGNIQISVVIFDVHYEPYNSAVNLVDALRTIFAFTPAIKLRDDDSPAYYQAGNYVELMPGFWAGRLQRQKALRSTEARPDPRYGFVFAGEGHGVVTFEAASQFAFNVADRVIAYRDRGSMPHTRLRTYVRRASGPHSFGVDVVPRAERRRVADWFEHFDEITSVAASYRHSQSPGNRGIDRILERYRAERIKEKVEARPGDRLDKEALLASDLPLASAIDHIDKNADNGDLLIAGRVSGDSIKVDTSDPVSRHLVRTESDEGAISSSLCRATHELARSSGGTAKPGPSAR